MLFSFDVTWDIMSYYWMMPFFVLVLIFFIGSAYALDPVLHPTGSITNQGCSAVNGTVVSYTNDSQKVSFCKFDSNFLSIVYYNKTSCYSISNSFAYTHGSKQYVIPTQCDIPRINGSDLGTYYVGEKQFNIKVNSTKPTLNDLIIIPENKTINIKSVCTTCFANTFLSVTFPNELLGGPFKVLENGNEANFDIIRIEANTTVTVRLDFHLPVSARNLTSMVVGEESKTEISGTQIFPQIPVDELSPKKQIENGVSADKVRCNTGFVLVVKLSDNSPACVKPQTAQKLVERGWGVLNEQTVWFEYVPIQCQQTPWDQYSSRFARAFTEPELIKVYFTEQHGITIIQSLWTNNPNLQVHPPLCGQPADFSYYFLVPEMDVNKMTSLGYKKVDTTPPEAHPVSLLVQEISKDQVIAKINEYAKQSHTCCLVDNYSYISYVFLKHNGEKNLPNFIVYKSNQTSKYIGEKWEEVSFIKLNDTNHGYLNISEYMANDTNSRYAWVFYTWHPIWTIMIFVDPLTGEVLGYYNAGCTVCT
jgi:hypothetical protein